MTVQFDYPDLWAFYRQAGADSQQGILEQMNIILDSVSSKTRIEILKDAPEDVVQKYNLVAPKARSLAQVEKELRRYIR